MVSSTAGPAHRVQSAVVEYGYPQGHLGHLSEQEAANLRRFKENVQEQGLWKPQSEAQEYGTHDDAVLLRFLRARRFNVDDAVKQFSDTEAWRAANEIEVVYETIDLQDYEETRRLYPQWTGRRDKRGFPVYVYEVRHLTSKAMAAYEKSSLQTQHKAKTDGKTSSKLLRLFALYENLVRFVIPLSTVLTDRDHPKTPITQSNNIVDISGVSLKHFWNLRSHMQDASTLATAHYPETLDRIFIIGAPSFFPTIWGWIKRWFDPITTSKIFILSASDVKSTLRHFIEPANIPKQFGGELDFEFGGYPILDPALKDQIEWLGDHKDYPRGPSYWVDHDDKIELRAVGTIDGKQRMETICFMKKIVEKHTLDKGATAAENGGAIPTPGPMSQARASQSVPNVDASNGSETAEPAETTRTAEEPSHHVVQDGEVIPASRPEPKSFETAPDGLNELLHKDKRPEAETPPAATNGAVHSTTTANLLDPAVATSDLRPGSATTQESSTTLTSDVAPEVSTRDHKHRSLKEMIKNKLHIEQK